MQQRKAILSALCARMPVCPSVDMAELAQQTTGYVGADLSALCREAAMNAIRENNKVNTSLKMCSILIFLIYVKKSKFMCHKCLVCCSTGFRRADHRGETLPGGAEVGAPFLPAEQPG